MLAKLLWAFDLEWEEGEERERYGWESQSTYALWPLWNKRALRVRIQERG